MKTALGFLGAAVLIGGAWLLLTNKPAPSLDNPIRIGAVISLTGIAASYGEPARNAMRLAVDEINANGGIDGRAVELVVEDDQTKPDKAISAFRKLTDIDRVDGVVGGTFDFATAPLFPVADAANVAFISPANMRIPGGLEPSGNNFVLMPDFSKVVRELKPYLETHQTGKLGVVHFKSVFGTQIATTLSEVMNELGRGPIVDESYVAIGDNDFRTTVIKLKQQGVETVFLDMVDVDPVNFLTAARDLDYHPTVISYYGIIDSFSKPGTDRSLLENVVILDWESSSEKFSKLYQERYGSPPVHSAEKGYVSVYVMAEAIAKAGSRENVALYLSSNSFKTPSGTFNFNQDHAVDSTPVRMQVVRNGQLVPLD